MHRKFTFRYYYLIPLIIIILTGSLQLIPGIQSADRGIYDLFLHIKPPVAEDPSLLLLDIDDLAISQVGTWPWSRSVIADGLLMLREFNTDTVVFDIEYVDASPKGVNSEYLDQEIPRMLDADFNDLNDNITGLFSALLDGYIPLEEAEDYITQLTDISSDVKQSLLAAIQEVARDNDEYLGRAFGVFGNAWATVNMLPNEVELIKVGPRLKEYVKESVPLAHVQTAPAYTPSLPAPAVQPTILPILTRAAGAGFPNVVVDSDGVRRRIDLLAGYGDGLYGQLVFAPLLQKMGHPQISAEEGSISVKSDAGDFSIPLDTEGRMIINWPKKSFEDSFRHLSYNQIVVHQKLEKQVFRNLDIMDKAGYLDFFDSESSLPDIYRYAQALKSELLEGTAPQNPDNIEEYIAARKVFFDSCAALAEGDTEEAILAEIDRVLSDPDLDAALWEEYQAIKKEVTDSFNEISTDIARISEIRNNLTDQLSGSFVIIGQTGISTSDIGVTPFAEEYMNVGTHAAVANTILQQDFLDELPWWISLAAALVLTLVLSFVIRHLSPGHSIIFGLVSIIAVVSAGLALFLITGMYLPMITPLMMVTLTFLTISGIKFIKTEGEKSFLRSAFSRYLSADVIKQIIDNPDRLNLGGEKKVLTAIFTDVKGFSTISEKLDPTDLVKLLNEYLTAMSDTILDLRGTIDKYEGDAIIAFFGAPIEMHDHAYKACLSAVRMKRTEIELNNQFTERGMSPGPLMTRIGINTGDMVVGNMGTLQKMDYTIMGSAVNMAARLEGVNKQYGTWILTSEQTRNAAGKAFISRQLDRVRVVGINEPVRLYELLEEHDRVDANTREGLDIFHAALELFEEREWEKCQELFRSVMKIFPEDGPSQFYIERARKYITQPPSDGWDGVFNLTLK